MRKNKIVLNSAGNSLKGVYWQADNPVATTFVVHGFGEHISRYEHVAHFFLKENISVIGVDHIGHGNSSGKRGYFHQSA